MCDVVQVIHTHKHLVLRCICYVEVLLGRREERGRQEDQSQEDTMDTVLKRPDLAVEAGTTRLCKVVCVVLSLK